MKFDRTPPTPLLGNEQFTIGGKPVGFTSLDFWSFQFSNVWDIYEEVAEFIVAKALGMTAPYNKNGWTSYDIKYREKRIEVKCTNDAYVFCLNTGMNKDTANPFEMNHWEFYVVSTNTINQKFDKQQTISVGCIRKIAKAIPFDQLKSAIDAVLGLK